MTTDSGARRRWGVGLATTGVAALTAATALSWAASRPVATSVAATVVQRAPAASSPDTAGRTAARRLAEERAALRAVRRDLPRLVKEADDIPLARLPQQLAPPSAQAPLSLPAAPAAPRSVTVAPAPAPAPAAAPPAHTTTGASGAGG